MPYTLKQAAEAIGKSKPTVLRAIQAGRISATRDEATGGWRIEPAELHRIYPTSATVTVREAVNGMVRNGPEIAETPELRARLDDAHRTIEDLRRRLDVADEERRRLTAILADQRAAPAPIRRWWRFGR